MSAPVNQDVLDKIKKLLRMDDGRGNTQAEVEQAMAAALKLAARHGIDLNEVDTAEDAEPPEPVVGEEFAPERTGGGECAARLPAANKYITWILEKFFRVQVIRITSWGKYEVKGTMQEGPVKRLQFFGRKTNVQIAIYVYNFLRNEFAILWHDYKRRMQAPMSSRNSFYYGLHAGLHKKLLETMGEVEVETAKQLEAKGTSMALVLVGEQEKVTEEVKKAHPRIKYVSTGDGDTSDDTAVWEGRRLGEKIEIRTALK
jgi:hypothetical protein